MREIAATFGSDEHLVGTLTLPVSTDPNAERCRLGVVLLNAGIVHRIGPHRLNVKLARRLAALGLPSLRFDITGVGDSQRPANALPYREQAAADIGQAIDHLARVSGVERVVIVGICSGAENGLRAAVADARVVGLWMFDGFTYPTARTAQQRHLHKLSTLGVKGVLGAVARRAVSLSSGWLGPASAADNLATITEDSTTGRPDAATFATWLQTLDHRGVSLWLTHSGTMLGNYSYPEQFHDAFGHHAFAARVRCDFRPDVDHTITPLSAQQELLGELAQWCSALAGRA